MQFYLLAPLLAAVFRISRPLLRRSVIVIAIAGAIIIQHLVIRSDARLSLTLANFIQFFLLGFVLADLYLVEWTSPSSHQRAWDLIGALGWPLLLVVWVAIPEPDVIFPLVTLAVFAATFRGHWARRIAANRGLTTIGGMCYSIYLLHYPFISAVGRYTIRASMGQTYSIALAMQCVLLLPLLLLVSVAYFVLIERPCMNKDWPQRLMAALSSVWSRRAHESGLDAHSL